MIRFLRKGLSSAAAIILLGLVGIAFVVTGIQNPFGGPSATGQGVLASVGDGEVTEADFTRLWQGALARLRQQNPALTNEQFAREGGFDRLLNELIAARAVEELARRDGARASPEMLDAEIARFPAFQLAGRFDMSAYEGALKQQNTTDREFRQALEGDLLRRQVLTPITLAAKVPDPVLEPYARLFLERREGAIGVVPTAAMQGAPTPGEADLARFYSSRRAQLTIPERRSFRYAVMDPAAIAPTIVVTEADITAFYRSNAARFSGEERRRLFQAPVADEAAARRLVALVRGGQTFPAAAQAVAGLAPGDLLLGDLTRAELASASGAKAADAAFSAQPGGVSDPVETELGWRVYSVTGVVPAVARPLEAVRGEIEAELRRTRAAEREAAMAEEAIDAAQDGASFADIARRLGLKVEEAPPVTAEGRGEGGVAVRPELMALVEAAFGSDPGDEPSVEDLGEGRAALFELGEVVAPVVPPLATIRPQIEAAWRQDWQFTRARGVADAVAAEVRRGATLADALRRRGLPPPQQVGGSRTELARAQQAGRPIQPPVIAFFNMPPEEVRVLPAPSGQGVFLIDVVRVVAPEPAEVAKIVTTIRPQFEQLAAAELTEQFAAAARAEVGVSLNGAAIQALRTRLAGGAAAAQP